MLRKSLSRILVSFCLVGLLTLTACSSEPPSRFENAQQESINAGNKNTAVEKQAIQGAKLNDVFPRSGGGYERVFTQEKDGFSQAKLKSNGQDLATLAVFDTISNPSAASAFANASDSVQGYPLVQKGSQQTAVLVGNRYQVSIRLGRF